MKRFVVWAPDHDRVELVLEVDPPARLPMSRGSGGWWSAEVPGAGPGTRYRFSLDGGPPRPDPRSPWQPEGIDGPSAVVALSAHHWSDGAWHGARLASAVLYELHVGTFTAEGTFDAVISHLDHLVELGVTAIELMPVAEFGGERGWGYDGVALWAPHHAYGGPDGLARLVDAAHGRGLAVVLDVVYNHLGPAGNYLAEFGPYFTDRYQTPWGSAVNFDGAGSDEVRRFVIDNACMWLEEYHLDGLRLDAVHAIVDESALHVLEELATTVDELADRLGRELWLIAESDRNDPRLVRSRDAGGYGLGASWSDDFHHALHAVLTGEGDGYYADFGRLSQVARAYERVYVYGRDFSAFRDRHHGRPVASGVAGNRFLGYLQNHDQVGNRAVGERSAALMSVGRLKVGAALVLLAPFVPMLFQGEEWAASAPFLYFTDHGDADLGAAVSAGRRREFAAFGWAPDDVPDPQARSTWERSVLDWSEPARPGSIHAEVLAWHQELIALRRSVPDLSSGELSRVSACADEEAGWIRVVRGGVVLAANLGADTVEVPVERRVGEGRGRGGVAAGSGPGWRLLAVSDPAVRLVAGGAPPLPLAALRLPPDSAAVLG